MKAVVDHSSRTLGAKALNMRKNSTSTRAQPSLHHLPIIIDDCTLTHEKTWFEHISKLRFHSLGVHCISDLACQTPYLSVVRKTTPVDRPTLFGRCIDPRHFESCGWLSHRSDRTRRMPVETSARQARGDHVAKRGDITDAPN